MDTFEAAETVWIPEVKRTWPGVPLFIVGTQMSGWTYDGKLVREAPKFKRYEDYTARGHDMARRLHAVKYVECKVSTREGLKEVFDEVSDLMATKSKTDTDLRCPVRQS